MMKLWKFRILPEIMNKISAFLRAISSYLIVAGVLAIVFFLITTQVPLLRYFFEKNAPVILMEKVPEGLGVKPQKILFTVEDDQSGIELIRARAEQSNISVDLYTNYLPLGTHSHQVELSLDATNLGFKKGVVRIVIEAFDRSLESNGVRHFFEVPVRFDSPEIEIITSQHNAQRTGMEFVVYRIKSDSASRSGVRVGSTLFEGFPAEQFDPELSGISDLHVCFFAIPLDFNDSTGKISVYASNSVGNVSERSFYYRIRERKARSWEYKLESPKTATFPYYEELREKLLSKPLHPEKLWSDFLIKPIGSDSSPRIGDSIVLISDETPQQEYTNFLLSFRTRGKAPVMLSNPGHLVYSGKTEKFRGLVILDHGFGLVSVYSGLNSVIENRQGPIPQGEILGETSVLSHLDSYGFEYGLFFQGVPVRPEEWWDKKWVFDHVLHKISEIKTRYNIRSVISRDGVIPGDGVISGDAQTEPLPGTELLPGTEPLPGGYERVPAYEHEVGNGKYYDEDRDF